jgi:hypothetical protein
MNMQTIVNDVLDPSAAQATAWEWPEEARATINARVASWAAACGDAEAMLASIGAYDRRMLVACSVQLARLLVRHDWPTYGQLRGALEACDRWVRQRATAGACRKMAASVFRRSFLDVAGEAVFAALSVIDEDDDLGRVARIVAGALADAQTRGRADYLRAYPQEFQQQLRALCSVVVDTLRAFLEGEWMPDEDRSVVETVILVAVDVHQQPMHGKVLAHKPARELESAIYSAVGTGCDLQSVVVVNVRIDQERICEPWMLDVELRRQVSIHIMRAIRYDSSLGSRRNPRIIQTDTVVPFEASQELCRSAWWAAKHLGIDKVMRSASELLARLGCDLLTDSTSVRKSAI